jgi:hydroxymethylpyrimidine pyrophosphatase-like HAD family hydrolase
MGMTSTIIASDLDRTLMYSPSALMLADTERTVQRLMCVEVYKGRPLSFVTERAAAMIADLNEAGLLVPATTRTVAQFQRIALPGPAPKFALCANGGRLLRDGVEDLEFSAAVTARLADQTAPMAELMTELSRASTTAGAQQFVEKVREAEGLFCYAVVDRKHLPEGWVDDLTGFAAARAWGVSVQGRKVYVVPTALKKATAARAVVEILGAGRLLAAGDSLLDGDLLEEADAAIRPAHGELAEAGWHRDHVRVTSARGVLAGEQILDWMTAETSTP